MNLYGFVGNSPVNRVDPLGLAWYSWLNPFNYSSDYANYQGQQALQAQLNNAGYQNMAQFNLDHPIQGDIQTAGDPTAVQTAANVASDLANGYVAAATAVTPGGAEEEAAAAALAKAAKCEKAATTAADAVSPAVRNAIYNGGIENVSQAEEKRLHNFMIKLLKTLKTLL